MALLPEQNNAGKPDLEQIHSAADFDNEAARKLVVQDAANADSFLQEKMWPTRWREIDILYQSPRPYSTWEGSNVQEANITNFTVAKHVNSIVPQLVGGVFYDDPPFLLRPRPGTSQNVVRAKTAVFISHLDAMNFEDQVEDGMFYTCLFGTAVYKWGYLHSKRTEARYVRAAQPIKAQGIGGSDVTVHTPKSDTFKVKDIEVDESRPEFEHIPLPYILVDPGCRYPDIRRAKWVIHRMYLTYNDLNSLRDNEGWDIPSEETLRSLLEPPVELAKGAGTAESMNTGVSVVGHAKPRSETSTVDPLETPWKVEERWDNHKVIAVLQDKLVIRNEANPFGVIPFYSSHWWRIPDSFYSLGVGHLVGQDQRVQQGLRNAALNLLGLACNPNYLRSRGANVPTQQIRQRRGGIIEVDGNVNEAFKILETPKVPGEVWSALQQSQAESESTSGADQLLSQGNTAGGRSSMGRTAGGAAQMAAAQASRLQGPVSRFLNNVFMPWLYQMDELDRERLPMSTLRKILGDELGQEFSVNEEDYLNAKLEYESLAGTRLSARKSMAQILPLISQIFENQQLLQQLQQTGWTVDVKELLAMFMEVSEWKNNRDFIRRLNDDEKQSMAATKQAESKVAAQSQILAQKGQQAQALADSNNEAKATNEVLRQVLQKTDVAAMTENGGLAVGQGN